MPSVLAGCWPCQDIVLKCTKISGHLRKIQDNVGTELSGSYFNPYLYTENPPKHDKKTSIAFEVIEGT